MRKHMRVQPVLRALILIAVSGLSSVCHAQPAGFHAGDGSTSIFPQNSGAISFNVADTSVKFGYVRRVSDRPYFWGVEGFRKALKWACRLLSERQVSIGGGRFCFVWQALRRNRRPHGGRGKKKSLKDSWVVFQATYKRSSFNNIPTDGVNAGNRKRNFDGYGATVSYNARLAAGGEGTGILVGFSGGVERRNNLDDLTPVTIETQVASAVAATTTTIAKTVKNGYVGNYKEYIAVKIYTDFIWLPTSWKSRIAFRCLHPLRCGQLQTLNCAGTGRLLHERGIAYQSNRWRTAFL